MIGRFTRVLGYVNSVLSNESSINKDHKALRHKTVRPSYYNRFHESFTIIAHRGASHYAPENTIAAFELAHEMGADMIELDVLLSKEGTPVVIHDMDLKMSTNGRGIVQNLTVQELKELDAGSWFSSEFKGEKIPLLEDVIAWAKDRISLNIEIKPEIATDKFRGSAEEKVLELIRKYDMEKYVLISSFDYGTVHHVKSEAPHISAAILFNDKKKEDRSLVPLLNRYHADGLNVAYSELNRQWIKESIEHETPLWVYTVNSKYRMRKLIRHGVTGIFSDRPDRLKKVVKQEFAD